MASKCSCHGRKLVFNPININVNRVQHGSRTLAKAALSDKRGSMDDDSVALPESFCIIEDRGTVADFASLQLDEISDSIQACFVFGHIVHAS